MTTTDTQKDLLDIARRYFAAIERRDLPALEELFDPAIVQHEYPNRLVPTGAVRDRAALFAGFHLAGTKGVTETYAVENAVVQGDTIALEVLWTGRFTIQIGSLAPGEAMRAKFAVFLVIRDGKIVAQRNYDCFDPF